MILKQSKNAPMKTKVRYTKAEILNPVIIHGPIILESKCKVLIFFLKSFFPFDWIMPLLERHPNNAHSTQTKYFLNYRLWQELKYFKGSLKPIATCRCRKYTWMKRKTCKLFYENIILKMQKQFLSQF